MAGVPIHQATRGGLTPRERLWATIRKVCSDSGEFTTSDMPANMSEDTVRAYLLGLERAGYIERVNPGRLMPGVRVHYRLVRDVGVEAPRVTTQGKPVTSGLPREQMWRTIRIITGGFTIAELSVNASTEAVPIAYATAMKYAQYLARAGYLRLVSKPQRHKPAVYRRVVSKYTGPKPPVVQRINQVFDANLGKVVWREGNDE